ncbi:epigen-like isoform X1 [Acipenser ruthenus]|uniref:epigen-like isoform X1 n=1 Tax=Acipenser ruthenus TaxID=7906 RepID=UPI0027408AA6|nr:epigen-like isoform X1 [Acipenser ruthenus]
MVGKEKAGLIHLLFFKKSKSNIMVTYGERFLLLGAVMAFTIMVACSSSTTVTEYSPENTDTLKGFEEYNDTTDNSSEMPRLLELQSPCTEDDQSFCMNGICSYHRELNTPTCRCTKDYTGERCHHLLLDSHTEEGPERCIAIGVGILLLIGGTMGVLYCCITKRCKKQKSPYQICPPDSAV